MSEEAGMMLEGLPEGIRAVRYGKANAGEYIYMGMIRGRDSGPGLVVVPIDGYDFVYNPAIAAYQVTKGLAQPRILTATFRIENTLDEAALRATFPAMPGFVALTEGVSGPLASEPWLGLLEKAREHEKHERVEVVELFLGRDGYNGCTFRSRSGLLAHGQSTKSMQEAVAYCLAALEGGNVPVG